VTAPPPATDRVRDPAWARPAADAAAAAPARRWALATDVRLEAFAVVFAFGTILHELQITREFMDTGPLFGYLDRWRPVPTAPWPSWLAAGLHLVNIAIAAGVIAGPRRRESLCLLAVTLLASLLTIPHRLASHNSVMAAAAAVVLALAAGEWAGRLRRRADAAPRPDWYAATLAGLAWIGALTYLFAFLYKLNTTWFSRGSPAPGFLIRSIAPVLGPLGVPGWRPVAGALAIHATLLVELALPPLLFHPRTRRVACLLGVIFHLPMVWGGVGDFPVIILAFYAAFLSREDLGDLLRRLARPTAVRAAAAAALGIQGIRLIQETHRARLIAQLAERATLAPWESWLTWAAALALAYVAVTLVPWCAATGRPGPGRQAEAAAGLSARPRPGPARAVAVLVVALFAASNAAPFVGVPGYGQMDMYSKASPDLRNHLFYAAIPPVGAFGYVRVARIEPDPVVAAANPGFHAMVRESQRQGYALNLNFVRYHLDRICDVAPGATVRLTLRPARGPERAYADACAERALRWYVPVPVVAHCRPGCPSLKRWVAEGAFPGPGALGPARRAVAGHAHGHDAS
jgi:hypothetical protein